jgi:hypothetical protein
MSLGDAFIKIIDKQKENDDDFPDEVADFFKGAVKTIFSQTDKFKNQDYETIKSERDELLHKNMKLMEQVIELKNKVESLEKEFNENRIRLLDLD